MFNWKYFGIVLAVFALNDAQISLKEGPYVYQINEFEVPVDHFNPFTNKTFKIRYLYNDTFVDTNSDVTPLFLYTGSEGDIELFAQNTGFMWELAAEMKAYVVFAEHRYYGESLPFGSSTFNVTEHLGYLTVEQALEDFGMLIRFLSNDKTARIPVVAFGGSYGGMLSAWMRMKYPHLIVGALAASAPVLIFHGLTPCDSFWKIATSVFSTSPSHYCSDNIHDSWAVLKNLSTTGEGLEQLNEIFNCCDPIKDSEGFGKFEGYLYGVYANLAMANYPYENNFLAPLPAHPVRQFCQYLEQKYEGLELVKALQQALNVYSNYTGTSKCLTTNAYDPTLGIEMWHLQACTQIVYLMCWKNTILPDVKWDFEEYSDYCFKKYGLRPQLDEMIFRYGGRELRYASNIIFSNGLLDPWSGGGVLETDKDKIFVIIIPEGAHHLDLQSSHPDDPASVKEARKQEKEIITQWILNY